MRGSKLTKRIIDELTPAEKIIRRWDGELSGFGIFVYPSGRKSFVVEYRPDGGGRNVNKKRMTLGRHGELTAAEARHRAQIILAEVRSGGDPLADRQSKRRELRISELIDLWEQENPIGRRTGRPMKPRTKQYTVSRLRNHVVPLIGKKRVGDVGVQDINDMIQRISNGATARDAPSPKKRGRIAVRGGPGAARKVASDLSILFSYAIEKRIVLSNPVSHARKPRAGKRQQFLSAQEINRLATALSDLEKEGANRLGTTILRLLLLTGARPGEIERLQWSEVDFELKCLRLGESKTGYSIRPLSTAALEILAKVPRANSKYVFPATRGDGHFTNSKKIWNQARLRANLPDRVRYHARHAIATIALSEGIDPVSVAAILGHAGPRTTLATYAHVINESAAKAAERVSNRVASAIDDAAALNTDRDNRE